MTPLNIVLIVRRFGPVGGMERYVWEMSQEMANLGHRITILCEQILADNIPDTMQVVTLGVVAAKPRWLAHLRFSRRVSQWIADHPEEKRVIHSHERTAVHHFTTFHGPPFATVRDKPLWKRISPRIFANLWLEKRELCGAEVRAIIPNSGLIAEALCRYYPGIKPRLAMPITPAVSALPRRPSRPVPACGGTIGFVGKEWRRKGLDIVAAIFNRLSQQRPDLKLVVAGPEPALVGDLFGADSERVELLGEVDVSTLYADFDLLLHPARMEPYGMVVAEARAAGVPVLVSDACGIAGELNAASVLPIDASIEQWCAASSKLIGQSTTPVTRSWRTVAEEQIACYLSHPPA